MDFNDNGISIDVNLVHPLNAKSPILVIPFSIETVVILDSNFNQGASKLDE
jgi:hypothetical protein